ncbi:MAG: hypothetical protein ACXQS8_03920, partial [Candidatus Helarchaeales archaeon]
RLELRIPESYGLGLLKDKEYMIEPPTEEEKSTYFIRAVINARSRADILLNKRVPPVYEKFFKI